MTTRAHLIDQFRPAFAQADGEWLLDEEEAIETLDESDGDVTLLVKELNNLADVYVLVWLPEHVGISQPEYRSFRQYAHALKGVAAMLGLTPNYGEDSFS